MMDAHAWAARLASGAPMAERVTLVVAHPDDETLFAGPLLGRLGDGVLIHLTDGAPADMADARRLGFATREEYVATRAAELDAARWAKPASAAPTACATRTPYSTSPRCWSA